MQRNQHLWVGILSGAGLTCLLIYFLYLYQQPDPATAPREPQVKIQTDATKPALKPTPQPPSIQPKTVETPETPKTPKKAQAVNTAETAQTAQTAQTAEVTEVTEVNLPGLPENPRLSTQALAELTPKEREKYEQVLKTYQQVREKVLKLHREREQLRQQMDQIIEEHTAMDEQLDQLREGLDKP